MSMGEPTIHKTCVRVNSADEESRDEVDRELPKKNPFIRVSVLFNLFLNDFIFAWRRHADVQHYVQSF